MPRQDQAEEYQQPTIHHARRQLGVIAARMNELRPPRTLPQLARRAQVLKTVVDTIASLYGPPDAQNTRVNLTLIGTMRQLDAASKSMLPLAQSANQTGGRAPFDQGSLIIDPPKDFPSNNGDQAIDVNPTIEPVTSSPKVDLQGDANAAGEG